MKNIFITSDWHLGHEDVIKFSERPFNSVIEMDITIINNFNKVVKDNDLTIHLGDFIWRAYNFKEVVERLNGYHIFIKGNHDHSYPSHRKTDKFEITKNQIYEFNYNDSYIVACHYPLYEWNKSFHGSLHCYGHSHRDLNYHKNAFHVGVDTHNYFPVNLHQIVS